MKIMYKFLLFMILFNIACVLMAASGFFGENVLYGDIVSDNPNEIISSEEVLENLFEEGGILPGIDIPIVGRIEFSFATLTIGIFAIAIGVGIATHTTPTVIPAAVVGSIFLLMWANSKDVFDQITTSLDDLVLYIALMVGVSFLFITIITVMDYLSGQASGDS